MILSRVTCRSAGSHRTTGSSHRRPGSGHKRPGSSHLGPGYVTVTDPRGHACSSSWSRNGSLLPPSTHCAPAFTAYSSSSSSDSYCRRRRRSSTIQLLWLIFAEYHFSPVRPYDVQIVFLSNEEIICLPGLCWPDPAVGAVGMLSCEGLLACWLSETSHNS